MQINIIDEILVDLGVFIESNYFVDEYAEKVKKYNTEYSIDKKLLEKYRLAITSINYAYKKTLKYELYFSYFYPDASNISHIDALEHHIHSYLEDLDILKNKVKHFLESFKNDRKKMSSNKKEVDMEFKDLVQKIVDVFKNMSDYRNPHHHVGMKFLDSDLVDAGLSAFALSDDFPLKNDLRPEFREELEKKKIESFEKAKSKWIKISNNNNIQITGFIDEIFNNYKPLIYDMLGIKPIKDVLNE